MFFVRINNIKVALTWASEGKKEGEEDCGLLGGALWEKKCQ